MTLSPNLGVVGISTLWHFRLPLPIQMFIKVASSPRLSGIGMPSPILWSHPLLKMQRIVLLSSLLWWELGTNSLITGPSEWLSFRRFTSKLSWTILTGSFLHTYTCSKSLFTHTHPIDPVRMYMHNQQVWFTCIQAAVSVYTYAPVGSVNSAHKQVPYYIHTEQAVFWISTSDSLVYTCTHRFV